MIFSAERIIIVQPDESRVIILVDRNGNIVDINPQGEKLLRATHIPI